MANNSKTPYKGIIRISCNAKCDKKPEPLLQVAATCIECDRSELEVLDLEGKVIAEKTEVRSQKSVVRKQKKQVPGSAKAITRVELPLRKPITDNY